MIKKVFALFIGLALAGLTNQSLFSPNQAKAAGTLTRISGPNRIQTAIATSKDLFGDGAVSELVIATSEN